MRHTQMVAMMLAGLAIAACADASAQVTARNMRFVGGCWAVRDKPGSDRTVKHFRLLPRGPWQEGPDRRTIVGRVDFLDGGSVGLTVDGDGASVVVVKDGQGFAFIPASANDTADGRPRAEFKSIKLGSPDRVLFVGGEGLSVTIRIGDVFHTVQAVGDGCD